MTDPPRRRIRRRGERDGPRPVGDALDAAVGRFGGADAAAVGRLFARWGDIAGEALAEHVAPVRYRGGVLLLAADHAAWATQVRTSAPSLLARIETLSGLAPDRLEVTVRRP